MIRWRAIISKYKGCHPFNELQCHLLAVPILDFRSALAIFYTKKIPKAVGGKTISIKNAEAANHAAQNRERLSIL
jgi:hypothetical protein